MTDDELIDEARRYAYAHSLDPYGAEASERYRRFADRIAELTAQLAEADARHSATVEAYHERLVDALARAERAEALIEQVRAWRGTAVHGLASGVHWSHAIHLLDDILDGADTGSDQ